MTSETNWLRDLRLSALREHGGILQFMLGDYHFRRWKTQDGSYIYDKAQLGDGFKEITANEFNAAMGVFSGGTNEQMGEYETADTTNDFSDAEET